jgi:hypothetical protein
VVGAPEIVAAAPTGVKVTPVGSAPATIDQANGAVPPLLVHVAKYEMPTCVGPEEGVQLTVKAAGAIVPE